MLLCAALVSIDSTMRSDLTVGPPIDFVVYKNNNINLDLKDKLKLDTPYFMNLSDIWHEKIISSFMIYQVFIGKIIFISGTPTRIRT